MRVRAHIRGLFPEGGKQGEQMRQHLLQLWDTFKTHGLVSGNFVEEFCSGNRAIFCQRYWEMLLANHLLERGLIPTTRSHGPDFRVEIQGRVIWIEVVAPTGGTGVDRIPDRFTNPVAYIEREREKNPEWMPGAVRLPVEETILRWASAIRYKYLKATNYIQQGILRDADAYLMEVNSCILAMVDYTEARV